MALVAIAGRRYTYTVCTTYCSLVPTYCALLTARRPRRSPSYCRSPGPAVPSRACRGGGGEARVRVKVRVRVRVRSNQRDKVLPVRCAQVRQALAVAAPLREVRVPVLSKAAAWRRRRRRPRGRGGWRHGSLLSDLSVLGPGQPGASSARLCQAPEPALSTRWPCWPGPDSAFASSLPRPQLKLKPLFSGAISRAVGVLGRPPPKDAGSELSMVGPPRRQRRAASSRASGLRAPQAKGS